MNSCWNDQEAQRWRGDVGLRVYTSRLLGREPALVLHGGGNTSVKTTVIDRFGAEQEALVVKGSGSDLALVAEEDFTPVRLAQVQRLMTLPDLTNDAMMDEIASCVLRANAPRASIETLLHASLPFKYVEHTHADSVLAITNTRNGEAIAAQVFGELAPLVPFHQSGFELAKACQAVFRLHATSRTIGLILLHHGVVAFGHTARESYENMLALVTLAERYLTEQGAWELPQDSSAPPPWAVETIAGLRQDVSKTAGFPLLLMQQDDPVWRSFAKRPDLAVICHEGPATPQHAVFAKRMPMLGMDVAGYARAYRDYVASGSPGATPSDLGLDPAPRVVVDSTVGVWTAGITAHYAEVTAQIFRHDVEIMIRAQGHDRYAGLSPASILDAEVHYGGFERRLRERDAASTALLGEVCLVAGAPTLLRDTVVATLRARGAAVATTQDCNVDGVLTLGPEADSSASGIEQGLRQLVTRFGGLDALVVLPGSPEKTWRQPASGLLALAPRGGRVVLVVADWTGPDALAHVIGEQQAISTVQVLVPSGPRDAAGQARLIADLCDPAVALLQPAVRLR